MKRVMLMLTLAFVAVAASLAADASAIAGKWQFLLEMPHGKRTGELSLTQDGATLGGSCELEKHGTSTITGSIQVAKVSMKIELHGNTITLIGTIDRNKMSGTTEPAGGTWKATRQTE